MTIVLLIACALIAAAGVPLILKLVPPNLGPVALFALLLSIIAIPSTAGEDLRTVAERSAFTKTGRYEEVVVLCAAFQRAYPAALRCVEFGRTPEGRQMLALIASRTGALTPEAARKKGLPVLLVQGGIHAGEIDGKDAGFLALREALENRAAKGALDRQVLVFVPVFNVDGHERFGRWNRPNQRGPEEMGWRTTSQNLNLNRDYSKADAPEMQAMLRLVNAWDPLAYIDLHVTDGAQFEHDIAVLIEPVDAGDAELQRVGRAMRDTLFADLATQGSSPLAVYPSFVVDDDPASGIRHGVPGPSWSHGYFHSRNRFGMLVEIHSWKDYPTRVRITRNLVISLLDQVAAHGREWRKIAQEADQRATRLGGQPVPLTYKAAETARTIDFRGYEYTRTPSDVSGALMTRYDESKPQMWKMPVLDQMLPDISVTAPGAGYLVPAGHAARVGPKLEQHGIAFRMLAAPIAKAHVETFRASKATFAPQSFEGRQRVTLEGGWKPETLDLGAGTLFVPIAQPKARLVMALLEPQAPGSLVAWGWFNTAFEKKEYMEAYVAEDVARAMLAADPALAADFRKKVAEDAEFAKSPAARLEFFHRRHSSWDERLNLYPVVRTASPPK